ncbi:MAG: glycosyltransferase family 4 protein [Desulforhopalus sp.]
MRQNNTQEMVAGQLTVVQLLPELDEGGVEGETLDLAIHLARRGHKSIVISAGGRLVPQLENNGCIHILWPYIGEKSLRCLQYIPRLRRFLLDKRIDILHLRSRLPAWIGYLTWKTLPVHQRPSLVTTFHGFYSTNAYSRIMTKGERVAAVSETIKQHIIENYKIDREKIRLIHGGFDESKFSPDSVAEERVETLRKRWLSGHEGKAVILLPGRFTQWKGQDIFIDSLSMLKNQNIICLLVGDIDASQAYTRRLEDRIRSHKLEDKVVLAGHCSDMPAALLLADLVVSASSTQPEAFGKVAIEAMAMGKPVIATAHGGSLETVLPGRTGWLVPPLDSKSLASALEEALADPQRSREYGQQGLKRANEHFTAQIMCEKTVALYVELYLQKLKRKNYTTLSVMQLLPELNSGGVERGTLEMGKHLVKNGHISHVVSSGGRLVKTLTEQGSYHTTRSIGSKSPLAVMHIWPLRKMMKRHHIDILHLRSRMPAWVGYLAWKSLPPKDRPLLVTTFHGFYSVNTYSAIMAKGEGVIAVSESIKRHIYEKYRRKDNVKLIFRGVDSEAFNPQIVKRDRIDRLTNQWGIVPARPVLMLPGRLTRLKGQEIFLQSLLHVASKNYQAILVGDTFDNPGYTAELNDFIEYHDLGDRVRLVGHCDDMPACFMIADIVLSTSSLEPEAFGRTTVEAMAMGKPVIATGHGGSLEIVVQGENGWLIKPSDPLGLALAIDEALAMDQENLRKLGQNGQKRVKENFTSQTMCEQTVVFYYDLLRQRGMANADN